MKVAAQSCEQKALPEVFPKPSPKHQPVNLKKSPRNPTILKFQLGKPSNREFPKTCFAPCTLGSNLVSMSSARECKVLVLELLGFRARRIKVYGVSALTLGHACGCPWCLGFSVQGFKGFGKFEHGRPFWVPWTRAHSNIPKPYIYVFLPHFPSRFKGTRRTN